MDAIDTAANTCVLDRIDSVKVRSTEDDGEEEEEKEKEKQQDRKSKGVVMARSQSVAGDWRPQVPVTRAFIAHEWECSPRESKFVCSSLVDGCITLDVRWRAVRCVGPHKFVSSTG